MNKNFVSVSAKLLMLIILIEMWEDLASKSLLSMPESELPGSYGYQLIAKTVNTAFFRKM